MNGLPPRRSLATRRRAQKCVDAFDDAAAKVSGAQSHPRSRWSTQLRESWLCGRLASRTASSATEATHYSDLSDVATLDTDSGGVLRSYVDPSLKIRLGPMW